MFARERIVRSHLRQRFVATLKSGDAFEGVLVDADARVLVFADAQMHLEAGPRPVDGHLFIERADVAYLQLTSIPQILPGVIAR